MSRPRYQTQGQRKSALLIATQIADYFSAHLVALGNASPLEFALTPPGEKRAIAGLDVRTRNNELLAYPTTVVSDIRVSAAERLLEKRQLPFLLAVDFTDRLAIFDSREIDFTKLRVARGGRTDRGDPADVELLRHFPVVLACALEDLKPIVVSPPE